MCPIKHSNIAAIIASNFNVQYYTSYCHIELIVRIVKRFQFIHIVQYCTQYCHVLVCRCHRSSDNILCWNRFQFCSICFQSFPSCPAACLLRLLLYDSVLTRIIAVQAVPLTTKLTFKLTEEQLYCPLAGLLLWRRGRRCRRGSSRRASGSRASGGRQNHSPKKRPGTRRPAARLGDAAENEVVTELQKAC